MSFFGLREEIPSLNIDKNFVTLRKDLNFGRRITDQDLNSIYKAVNNNDYTIVFAPRRAGKTTILRSVVGKLLADTGKDLRILFVTSMQPQLDYVFRDLYEDLSTRIDTSSLKCKIRSTKEIMMSNGETTNTISFIPYYNIDRIRRLAFFDYIFLDDVEYMTNINNIFDKYRYPVKHVVAASSDVYTSVFADTNSVMKPHASIQSIYLY